MDGVRFKIHVCEEQVKTSTDQTVKHKLFIMVTAIITVIILIAQGKEEVEETGENNQPVPGRLDFI